MLLFVIYLTLGVISFSQELSMKWAKPILEYQEQKQSRKEVGEPHMIHIVSRVKTMKGRPWWEKDVCKEFGLDEKVLYS